MWHACFVTKSGVGLEDHFSVDCQWGANLIAPSIGGVAGNIERLWTVFRTSGRTVR